MSPSLKDPEDLVPTVISGLTCYFDKSLGTHLLYRFERKQYAEIRKRFYTGPHVRVGVDEKEMSEIYGAEHLLRLLGASSGKCILNLTEGLPVSLPQMVAQTTLDPESVNIIKEYVNELLQWVASCVSRRQESLINASAGTCSERGSESFPRSIQLWAPRIRMSLGREVYCSSSFQGYRTVLHS